MGENVIQQVSLLSYKYLQISSLTEILLLIFPTQSPRQVIYSYFAEKEN